jgi:hypothetical protein
MGYYDPVKSARDEEKKRKEDEQKKVGEGERIKRTKYQH